VLGEPVVQPFGPVFVLYEFVDAMDEIHRGFCRRSIFQRDCLLRFTADAADHFRRWGAIDVPGLLFGESLRDPDEHLVSIELAETLP